MTALRSLYAHSGFTERLHAPPCSGDDRGNTGGESGLVKRFCFNGDLLVCNSIGRIAGEHQRAAVEVMLGRADAFSVTARPVLNAESAPTVVPALFTPTTRK